MPDLTRNMNELPSHEKRVCLFAAQQLASGRNGGFVTIDSCPDEEERQQPAIDLLAHDSLRSISVEHTLIASYSTQLHDNRRVNEVFADFPTRFDHLLEPTGRYTLAIHTRGGHLFPRKHEAKELDRLWALDPHSTAAGTGNPAEVAQSRDGPATTFTGFCDSVSNALCCRRRRLFATRLSALI